MSKSRKNSIDILYKNIPSIYRKKFLFITKDFQLSLSRDKSYKKGRIYIIDKLKDMISRLNHEPSLVGELEQIEFNAEQKVITENITFVKKILSDFLKMLKEPDYNYYYGLYITTLLSTLTLSYEKTNRFVYTDIRGKTPLKEKLHPDRWKMISINSLISKILYLFNPQTKKHKERIENILRWVFEEIMMGVDNPVGYSIEISSDIPAKEIYKDRCVTTCMTNNPDNVLSFYDNYDIKVIQIKKHEKMIGRALLWKDVSLLYLTNSGSDNQYRLEAINIYYVDRIYISDPLSKRYVAEIIKDKFKNKKVIFHRSWERNQSEDINATIKGDENSEQKYLVMCKYIEDMKDDDEFPYQDTFDKYVPVKIARYPEANNKEKYGMILIGIDELSYNSNYITKDMEAINLTPSVIKQKTKMKNGVFYLVDESEPLSLYQFLDEKSMLILNEYNSLHINVYHTKDYFHCAECGRILHDDNGNYSEHYGEYLCGECSVYSDKLGTYLPRSLAIFLDNYEDWFPEDDIIITYNDNPVYYEDAEVIEILEEGERRFVWIDSSLEVEDEYNLVYSNHYECYLPADECYYDAELEDYLLKNEMDIKEE